MAQDPSELDPVDPELDLEDESTDPAGDVDEIEEQDETLEAIETAVPERREERPPSRRDARIQRVLEETRRKDAEMADLRRRLDELTARQAAPAPAPRQETDEERAARYESMSPGQAMVEALKEAENRFAQRMNATAAQTADTVDKTSFEAKASKDPRRAKWAPKVEARLAELRRQGINMNRDVLYFYMWGEAADAAANSPTAERGREEARRRVQRRTTRPADSGSDTAPTREQRRGTDDAAARERRLANMQI